MKREKMEKERLQKIISAAGYCSRRKAEEYISFGAVKINGRTASIGEKADSENDVITVNGERIKFKKNLRYIKLYKPRGYVTTLADTHGRHIITELLSGIEERLYPIGRLDKNSEGLLLLTNDGELANAVTHPKRSVKKIYRVTVKQIVSETTIAKLMAGLDIGNGEFTRPCQVREIVAGTSGTSENPRTVLEFIITEGKNRQVRRMCEAVDLAVARLRRISVGGVKLGMLKPGEYADLKKEELNALRNIIKTSEHNKI